MSGRLAQLHLEADLRCELDDRPLSIRVADGTAVVEFPDVATALKLFRLGSPRGSYARRLRSIKTLLDLMQLQLELRLRSHPIIRLGWKTGNPVWRAFGLPPMHLSLRPLLPR